MWTKEALLPSWKRTKGHVVDRFINRWAVTFICGIVTTVNTIMNIYFTTHFGPAFSFLTAVLVAPITEELYKYLTIQLEEKEWGWFYFNVGEWLYYVRRAGGISFRNIPVMVIRLIITLTHLMYTKIWADNDKNIPKGLSSLLHAIHNGPFKYVSNLVSEVGLRLFGIYGWYFTTIGMLIGEMKVILKTILKLKHPKKKEEFVSEPIPQTV